MKINIFWTTFVSIKYEYVYVRVVYERRERIRKNKKTKPCVRIEYTVFGAVGNGRFRFVYFVINKKIIK